MAQEVITRLTDDIDGGDADVTVTFGFDGEHFEIDLSKLHALEFTQAMSHFVEHARKVKPAAGSRSPGSRAPRKKNQNNIREWAQKERGYPVGNRGRIPAAIVTEYENCH
jgi:hypothetical protein